MRRGGAGAGFGAASCEASALFESEALIIQRWVTLGKSEERALLLGCGFSRLLPEQLAREAAELGRDLRVVRSAPAARRS